MVFNNNKKKKRKTTRQDGILDYFCIRELPGFSFNFSLVEKQKKNKKFGFVGCLEVLGGVRFVHVAADDSMDLRDVMLEELEVFSELVASRQVVM